MTPIKLTESSYAPIYAKRFFDNHTISFMKLHINIRCAISVSQSDYFPYALIRTFYCLHSTQNLHVEWHTNCEHITKAHEIPMLQWMLAIIILPFDICNKQFINTQFQFCCNDVINLSTHERFVFVFSCLNSNQMELHWCADNWSNIRFEIDAIARDVLRDYSLQTIEQIIVVIPMPNTILILLYIFATRAPHKP